MLSLFKTRAAKTIIGLDISSQVLRLVEAKGKAKSPQLLHVEHIEMTEQVFIDGIVEDSDNFTQVLQSLLMRCYHKDIILSVDNQFITHCKLQLEPGLSAEDIEDNLTLELERRLSYSLDEAYFDYYPTNKPNKKSDDLQEFHVIATRRQIVDSLVSCISNLGYNVKQVSYCSSVLSNFLQTLLSAQQQKTITGLIYKNEHQATIVVCQQQQQLFSDSITTNDDSPEQVIQSLLTLAQTELEPAKIEQLYLSGATSFTACDTASLSTELSIAVAVLNPFTRCKGSPDTEHPSSYTLAMALAIEGLAT
jgi:Tfp pilus assembly PilM family ATPase